MRRQAQLGSSNYDDSSGKGSDINVDKDAPDSDKEDGALTNLQSRHEKERDQRGQRSRDNGQNKTQGGLYYYTW